jgi:YD repeat-containing protein
LLTLNLSRLLSLLPRTCAILVTNPITGSGLALGYRYDDAGNRTGLIYPDGRDVTYAYDGDNRLLQVDDWNGGITSYQYDGAGRLITTTLPNGVVSVNAYDDAGRLLSLRHEGGDGSLLAEYLYQLDGAGNRVAVTATVRAPDVVQTIEAYVEQNGLLVLEAENGTATAGASHDWETQTAQAGYEGTGYRRALPDIGARYEETETASSPQLSWPIYNETGDTYSVWVRGMAPDAGGDSLHVGLDGTTPSTAADMTGFTDEWTWSKATMAGGDATVDLTATGEHTLAAWMREDGLRVDRVLLVTDTNYIPTGLGPAESPFQTITWF